MKRRKREKKEGMRGGVPDAFVLSEGALVARGTVAAGGVPLLVYHITLPMLAREDAAEKGVARRRRAGEDKAAARVNAFYGDIAAEIWRACEGTLFPFVRQRYEDSDDPQKRYRFARYILTVDFTLSREGEEIAVLRRAVLSRRGKALFSKEWRERFCAKSGWLAMARCARLAAAVRPKGSLRAELKGAILPRASHGERDTDKEKGEI